MKISCPKLHNAPLKLQYPTSLHELAEPSARPTPYLSSPCATTCHACGRALYIRRHRSATTSIKEAHGESSLLSPPHSSTFSLPPSVVVVVAVIAQQPCGIPTAQDMCCRMSRISKKSPFQARRHTSSDRLKARVARKVVYCSISVTETHYSEDVVKTCVSQLSPELWTVSTHSVRCGSVCAGTRTGTRCRGATRYRTAPSPGSTATSRHVCCPCVSRVVLLNLWANVCCQARLKSQSLITSVIHV